MRGNTTRADRSCGAVSTPTTIARVLRLEPEDGRTTMVIETTSPSLEAMEQLAATGMEEGITPAIGQIDDMLH